MDKKDENTEKGSCCDSSGSCGCGRHCCGGRAALVLVLLLIGGLIGYAIGHCHSSRMGCSYMMNAGVPTAPVK